MSDLETAARAASGQRRYYTLDGLRGFAALLVASYHLGLMTVEAVPYGYLAVDFFFMLSGFVIALNYQHRMDQGMSFAHFTELRFVRLYPLFFLGMIAGIPARCLRAALSGAIPFGMSDVPVFIANIVMLPSPSTELLFPFNGALWSLFIEMLVSLSFGALLYRASNRVLIVLMLSAAAALAFLFVKPNDFIDMGWGRSNLLGGITRACFGFPLGMLLYRHLHWFRSRQSYVALIPFLILAVVMATYVAPDYRGIRDIVAVFFVFPLALAIGIAAEPPASLRRLFAALGDTSYPAYVFHSPLVVATAFVTVGTGAHSFTIHAVFLIVLCSVGLVTARYVDAPVRAWLTRQLGRRQAGSQTLLRPA